MLKYIKNHISLRTDENIEIEPPSLVHVGSSIVAAPNLDLQTPRVAETSGFRKQEKHKKCKEMFKVFVVFISLCSLCSLCSFVLDRSTSMR